VLQYLLVALLLIALYERAPQGAIDPYLGAAFAFFGVLLTGVVAEASAALLTRRIWYDRASRARQIRWYHRARRWHLLLAVVMYLATLFVADWDLVVRNAWGLGGSPILSASLLILPFILSMLLGWASFYRVEAALHQTASSALLQPRYWSRGQYVCFQARQNLGLVLAAALVFFTLQELAGWLFPNLPPDSWQVLLIHGAVALVVVLLLPWLLVTVWPTRSLAPGPLRHQLEAVGRRLGFRCTDIRVWDTGGSMANAMVVGLFRAPRYVLLSDLLIEALPPEEIEAVFGHEVAHVRLRHVPLYMVFLTLGMLLVGVANEPVAAWLAPHWVWTVQVPLAGTMSLGGWLPQLVALLVPGALLLLAFGGLSRTCERQADVFGCKAVRTPPSIAQVATISQNGAGHFQIATHVVEETAPGTLQPHGIRVFISTLQRVAAVNGMDPHRPDWRHGSIASRVRFLESLLLDPQAEPRFQRHALFLKLGLLLTLAGLVGLLWWLTGGIALI
jgi:STE24 endopeptidase